MTLYLCKDCGHQEKDNKEPIGCGYICAAVIYLAQNDRIEYDDDEQYEVMKELLENQILCQ